MNLDSENKESSHVHESRGRVLIVDDSDHMLESLARLVGDRNYEVETASDGETARKLLQKSTFNTVISDIQMPGMDGIELLRVAREQDFDLPVILITGSPDLDSAILAVQHGAFHYFSKSFDPVEFIKTIEKAVRLHRFSVTKREALELLNVPPVAGDLASLDASFSNAIKTLWMAFQPIVQARDHKVFGYEALMRSSEPGLPHPGAVLDAAEKLGRLPEVGRTVWNRTALAILDASDRGLTFVNLHPRDLMDDALVKPDGPLARMADRVVLEVTERASLGNLADISARISALRDRGYRIAIDDLGAGFASLNSFVQLEPEFVKIDMALVRDVHTSTVKQKLIRSVTSMCHEMDIQVVGEGVETPEERDTLVELGCDLLQGYLLAKPGPPFPEVTW